MSRLRAGHFALQSRRPWKTSTNLSSSHSGGLGGSSGCVLESPVELGNHHAQAAPDQVNKNSRVAAGIPRLFMFL